MTNASPLEIAGVLLQEHEAVLGASWVACLDARAPHTTGKCAVRRRAHCEALLAALGEALRAGARHDIEQGAWKAMRGVLEEVATARARDGSTPLDTATFILSLKQALFDQLRRALAARPETLAEVLWAISSLLDSLGLYTLELFQRDRDLVIERQHMELLELSTPVIDLWDGVLALPLIGTLDSMRAQVVMESVLQKIADTGAQVAIIDITGVPAVDTLVAQHLMRTIAAARLMGAECMICGISPQIAQTIVHLGVEFGDVITKPTLADAFALALDRRAASQRTARAMKAPS